MERCMHEQVEYVNRTARKHFIYRCLQCGRLGESSLEFYAFERLVKDDKTADRYPVYRKRDRE